MTFWTKAASSSATSSIRPGYAIVVDGKIGGGDDYKYGDYVNDIANEWQKVTYTFTLSEQTTVNVLVMISKNAKGPVLIDDFVLMKGDTKLISSQRRARRK